MTNECGNSIATLRTDNEGEYLSNDFETYLKSKGIHHELTAPIHLLRTELLRGLTAPWLVRAGLPEKFWAETVATAAYLKNRMVIDSVDIGPHA